MGETSGSDLPATASLQTLNLVGESVAKGEHFREVISLATQEAAKFIGASRSYSALYDEAMGQLFEVYSSQVGEGYRAAIAVGADEMPERISVREGEFVEVASVEEWDGAPEALKSEGIGSMVVFPLKAGERTLGLMSFYFDGPRELRVEEIDFCSVLALQGAAAVARALSLAEPPPER